MKREYYIDWKEDGKRQHARFDNDDYMHRYAAELSKRVGEVITTSQPEKADKENTIVHTYRNGKDDEVTYYSKGKKLYTRKQKDRSEMLETAKLSSVHMNALAKAQGGQG